MLLYICILGMLPQRFAFFVNFLLVILFITKINVDTNNLFYFIQKYNNGRFTSILGLVYKLLFHQSFLLCV